MNKAVLNVAFGSWYGRGQGRLLESLRAVGYGGERIFWRHGLPAGSPSHLESPYAFKPAAFDVARRADVGLALWLDASCWATKPIEPIFAALAERDVLLLEEDKYTIGQWCTDAALSTLGFESRDEAMEVPTCYALFVGINLTTERGNEFLDRWLDLSHDGVSFVGPRDNRDGRASPDPRVLGHGHDQSAAAAIARQMGIPMHKGWLPFFSLPSWPRHEEAIILAQGM